MQAFVPGVVLGITAALLLVLGVASLLTPGPPPGESRVAAGRSQFGAPIAAIGLGSLSAVAAVLSILSAL